MSAPCSTSGCRMGLATWSAKILSSWATDANVRQVFMSYNRNGDIEASLIALCVNAGFRVHCLGKGTRTRIRLDDGSSAGLQSVQKAL